MFKKTYVLFAHAGYDIGIEHSWRVGASLHKTSAADRISDAVPDMPGTAGGVSNSYSTATGALQDPHRVEARPSLIAKARPLQVGILVSGKQRLPVLEISAAAATINIMPPLPRRWSDRNPA